MRDLARALRLSSVGNALFLRVSRVVRRIDIVDLPRSDPVKLNDRFAFGPGGMFHSSGPETERPGRKPFCTISIERFSGCEIKDPRNHSDTLGFWMGMRCDMIAVRELKAYHEGACLRWIAFENGHLCARGQSRGPAFHSIVVGGYRCMSVDGISLADNRVRRKTAVRNAANAELKIVFIDLLLLRWFGMTSR